MESGPKEHRSHSAIGGEKTVRQPTSSQSIWDRRSLVNAFRRGPANACGTSSGRLGNDREYKKTSRKFVLVPTNLFSTVEIAIADEKKEC